MNKMFDIKITDLQRGDAVKFNTRYLNSSYFYFRDEILNKICYISKTKKLENSFKIIFRISNPYNGRKYVMNVRLYSCWASPIDEVIEEIVELKEE